MYITVHQHILSPTSLLPGSPLIAFSDYDFDKIYKLKVYFIVKNVNEEQAAWAQVNVIVPNVHSV